jgi:Rieske Fe-S protein
MKLKPSEFIFNGDESNTKVLGFIAQDVQETMREEGMATGYGMVSQMTEDRLGLATTELIPVLTKAIQEQQAVIDELQRRVEALELRVEN